MDDAASRARPRAPSAIWRAIVERLVDRQRPAREALREILARTSSMREEARAVDVVQAVDRGDVRVVERREQLGLALEARQALGIAGEAVGEDLDRDVALERVSVARQTSPMPPSPIFSTRR